MLIDTPARTPAALPALRSAATARGFAMSCDARTGSLLATLAAGTGPGGRILELGTGLGEGAAWLLDGAADDARLVTVELDGDLQAVARGQLGGDPRIEFVTGDGGAWLEAYDGPQFDLVFADTWPGKYTHLQEALSLVRPGGAYLVDDLHPQPGWPAGHEASVTRLLTELDSHPALRTTRLAWASGLLLAVRTA